MGTLATLVVKLTADTGDFVNQIGAAEKSTSSMLSGIGSNIEGVGKAALGGLAVVGGAAAAAGAAILGLAASAAPVEGLRNAFEGLATSSGQSADVLMDAFQRGSSGMVSQRDLMETYNKAAQLVGTTFANQLPDAMQYLSKVSAATGQDMGFLLNSLAVGVGRLSPMILDNLAIQVSLTEATDRAAEMYGVAAEELTKEQKQAGMMAVVLDKLKQNTEAMPDVTGSAAQRMAQFKATIQDTKDQIGMAFLPILATLLGGLLKLADAVLPKLTSFLEGTVAPAVELVVGFFEQFVAGLGAGLSPLEAFQTALASIGLGELAAGFGEVVATIQTAIETIVTTAEPFVAMIIDWVSKNIELKDVLMGLGLAIASVVVPAIAGIIAAAAPLILTAVALIAGVALLRKAWESDFGGIRTFVLETLTQIRAWWAEHGEQVIATVTGFLQTVWETIQTVFTTVQAFISTALAAIQAWWSEHGEQVKATIAGFMESARATIQTIITAISTIISTVLGAIQAWWSTHGEQVNAIVTGFMELVRAAIETATTAISTIISTVLGAIQGFWQAHGEEIMAFASSAWETIQTIIDSALGIIQGIIKAVTSALKGDWHSFGLALEDIWDRLWETLKSILNTAWEGIKALVSIGLDAVVNLVTGIGSRLYDAGKAIIGKLKEGLSAALDDVKRWFEDKLRELTDLLPWSEPKDITSPFRHLADSGEAFVENWLVGFERAAPRLEAAVRGMAGLTLQAAPAGPSWGSAVPGRASVTFYGPVYVNGVEDAEGLLEELQGMGM